MSALAGHVYGQVDDCRRCIYCEILPGKTSICDARVDYSDSGLPEDWEDYADEAAHLYSEWTAEDALAYWD